MKLIGAHISPYFERVWLQLYLKDNTDAVELAGLPGGGLRSPQHLAQNPIGRIPYLQMDDGGFLPESQVICDYLERKFPERPLRPSNPEEAARTDLINRLLDVYILPPVVKLAQAAAFANADADRLASLTDEVQTGLGYLEHFFHPGSRAVGGDWTLADCALVPFLFTLQLAENGLKTDLLGAQSRVKSYAELIKQTDAAQKAFAKMQRSLEEILAAARAAQ